MKLWIKLRRRKHEKTAERLNSWNFRTTHAHVTPRQTSLLRMNANDDERMNESADRKERNERDRVEMPATRVLCVCVCVCTTVHCTRVCSGDSQLVRVCLCACVLVYTVGLRKNQVARGTNADATPTATSSSHLIRTSGNRQHEPTCSSPANHPQPWTWLLNATNSFRVFSSIWWSWFFSYAFSGVNRRNTRQARRHWSSAN